MTIRHRPALKTLNCRAAAAHHPASTTAGIEIGGRIQVAPGTGNPLCYAVRKMNPTAYNQVLK